MVKLFTRLAFFGLAANSVSADNAVFRSVWGKVEYQTPGTVWKPAKPGISIPAGALISTAFRSFAVVNLGDYYSAGKESDGNTSSSLSSGR
ncbi:MAG: hypothetical protein HKM05_03920 [Spirochaetales bacterium]|nr:hypothetical protein [Spirochaetales bacterium]